MNKNNTVFFAATAVVAALATGCTTGAYYGYGYDTGYSTTTYAVEPVYSTTYVNTTVVDVTPPPRYCGPRRPHRHYRDMRPAAKVHRPQPARPSHMVRPAPAKPPHAARPANAPRPSHAGKGGGSSRGGRGR